MTIEIKVTKNDWHRLAKAYREKIPVLVAKTALDVQGDAAQRSRVDTGTMKNGWQTRHDDAYHATVFNPIHYAAYNEYGTVRMAAQPMITPAVERRRPAFLAAIKKLIGG